MALVLSRRSLFRLAAPAIVASTAIMKVSALAMPAPWDIEAMAARVDGMLDAEWDRIAQPAWPWEPPTERALALWRAECQASAIRHANRRFRDLEVG